MLKTILRFALMDMGRNIYRLALMVLAVVGALTTYTLLGLVFDDISVQAMVQWRGDWPFDITMRGAGVADIEAEVRQLTGERSLRGAKTKMKVSGQFQNVKTASFYANIKSYLETCYRNGINEFFALHRLCRGDPFTLEEVFNDAEKG